MLKQCYDFDPTFNYAVGQYGSTDAATLLESNEIRNTIHQYFESEQTKIKQYKIWYHERGSSQNITAFLKKNHQKIENNDYKDSPFTHVNLNTLQKQLPRLDQLVFFQREIMKLS